MISMFTLTSEMQEYVSVIEQLVARDLEPAAEEVEDRDEIPGELVAKMRDLGLFGVTIPEAHGGLGATMLEYCHVAMALARTHQAFRTLININNGIGSRGIVLFGSSEQQGHYLPSIASGERLVAFALTEPEGGSDVRSLATTAQFHGDGFVLNGTKQFVTNGPVADTILVVARTPSGATSGWTAFLIDTRNGDPAGLVRGAPDRKMGFRGSKTGQLIFEDCYVPATSLLGELNGGFRIATSAIDDGRLAVSAGAIGASKYLLDLAIEYASQREQFGSPIIEHQAIGHQIANMSVEIELAENMLLSTAQLRDQSGRGLRRRAATTKLFATEMANRVADSTLQVFGGYGYMRDLPIERFYRDLRLLRIVEGTSEIQRNAILRELRKERSSTGRKP